MPFNEAFPGNVIILVAAYNYFKKVLNHESLFTYLTYNEIIHINRVLEKASLFNEVVIVDSNSNDGTYEFVKNLSKNNNNVHLLNNLYISQSKQLQWVLKNFQFKNDFIFKLDADEIISEELIMELQKIFTNKKILHDGYSINRNIVFW